MKTKKKSDQALAKSIPDLYQSLPDREYAEHEDFGERICGLFEEINAIIEEKFELTGFCDA